MHVLLGNGTLFKGDRDFAATVGPEIKTHNHVAVLYGAQRCAVAVGSDDRSDKFVGYSVIIGLLQGCDHIPGRRANPMYQEVICLAHTFPTVIPVHRIISPDCGSEASGAAGQELFYIPYVANTGTGVCVAPIQKGMNENLVTVEPCLSRCFTQPFKVQCMCMYATV